MRVSYGWGEVPEAVWPLSHEWPPVEPEGLDQVAKARRILLYQRVRNLSDCRIVLNQIHPVAAAFEITEQWIHAPQGRIEVPGPNDTIIGSHAVCLLGLCNDGSEIKFVNSWGENWGNRGFGYLPVAYFDKHIVSAWTFEIHKREDEITDYIQYLRMGFKGKLGDAVHIREIYDSQTDERMAWSIAVQRESVLDIEDLFVRPQYRGRRFGHELCEMLMELSKETNSRIRVWFSHADRNGPIEQHLCKTMGLNIVPSSVRWARFVAIENGASISEPKDMPKPSIWKSL
jgi:GNAT superfamily N-acetyltransferase